MSGTWIDNAFADYAHGQLSHPSEYEAFEKECKECVELLWPMISREPATAPIPTYARSQYIVAHLVGHETPNDPRLIAYLRRLAPELRVMVVKTYGARG